MPPVTVVRFFCLALGLSWLGWVPFAAARAGRFPWPVAAEWTWLAEYGPALAALLLLGREGGLAAVRSFLGRLIRWRVPGRWYLVAIGLTPVASLLVLAGWAASGHPVDLAALGGWEERFAARTAAFTPSLGIIDGLVRFMSHGPWATGLVFLGLAVSNGGLSEEPGWRGYALDRLQAGAAPWKASLTVAVLWAFWHTGTGFWLVVFTQTPGETLRFAAGYLAQYLVLLLPLSVLYTRVANGARGSLLPPVLLHASYNMTVTVMSSTWPDYPLPWLVGLFWLAALGLLWITRGRLGMPGPAPA